MKSIQECGFNFLIPFDELFFDSKTDLLGSGGYGDVFSGNWAGTTVAIKKFGKKNCLSSQKAIKDFVKEIEVVNSLRHPNIILYMGVSTDNCN